MGSGLSKPGQLATHSPEPTTKNLSSGHLVHYLFEGPVHLSQVE